MKQHGALLAKGRLTGVQFEALFTDGLYLKIARHANEQAKRLRAIMIRNGLRPFNNSPANQQFFIIPDEMIKELEKEVVFETWGRYDEQHTTCRFVTSWATTDEELEELEGKVKK